MTGMPSICIRKPRIDGGDVIRYLERPASYTHTIQANGGYWSARITIPGQILDLDEWIEQGLNRRITVYDDALDICWDGFVNKVSAAYAGLTVERGPLLSTGNRADLYYSYVDNSVVPPIVGLRFNTGVVDDAVSQAKWGILYKILSTGGCVPADAAQIVATYVEENAQPATTKQWASGRGGAPSVTIECLGFCHWFNYPYNQTAASGSITTDTKILAIIAANPNIAWLPFGVANISAPAAPANVDRWENDSNLAWELIMDAVNRGDTNNARWLFGVYGDLAASYNIVPTEAEYHQRLTDPAQRITTPAGVEVPPWRVLPGRWMLFPDLLVASAGMADLRDDPRAMFIESVTYTLPRGLQLRGGKINTLKQQLANLGLSGIGG